MNTLENLIPTDKTFSVGVDLNIPEILKLKDYLSINCENKYNFSPHIGLVMTSINPKYLNKAFEFCINYFKNKKVFFTAIDPVEFINDSINPEYTMIDLKIVGKELYTMHKELLTYLSSNYKDNYVREKDLERLKAGILNEVQANYVIKYGFSYVLDLFKPHITVGSIPTKYLTSELKQKITNETKHLVGKGLQIKNIHIIYHTSPKIQSDTVVIKREDINLLE